MPRESKHVLSHAAAYLVARGLPGIIAFLAIPLFSRLLSPADYGRYALVIATVSLLNALLFQGVRLSLVRYLPACRDNPGQLKSTLASLSGALVLLLGAVAAVICLMPATADWRSVTLLCWVVLAVQAAFDLCCEHARASLRPRRYMVMQLLRASAMVVLGTALVLGGMRWSGPIAGLTVGMAMGVVWAWRKDWSDVRFIVDRRILRKVIQYGGPLSLTVALAVVMSTSDRFLIAWLKDDAAAGLYSAAFDFTTQTLTLLMMVISLAIFPVAVHAWEEQGPRAAREQMRSNASLLMAVGVPCVVGLALLAPGISNCFLGRSFRTAATEIIPLVALGAFLAGLKAYHFDAAFQFADKTIHQVWIVLLAAGVNVGLNLLAIPLFGIKGAAGASVLAFAVSIILTIWVGRRYFALPFPLRSSLEVIGAAGVMAALLYPFRGHHGMAAVAAQIAGGAAVYGLMLMLLNFMDLREQLMQKWRTKRTERSAPVEARPESATLPDAAVAVESAGTWVETHERVF